jgi:hypothetical protein
MTSVPSAECNVKMKPKHAKPALRIAHTERVATEIPKLSDVTTFATSLT